MCPGNRGQGRNYPQTAGDRESAVQAKPGEVRAWQGLSPAVGDRAEIPAQGRNPYKEQKSLQRAEIPAQSRNLCTEQKLLHLWVSAWQGQTVVAENLFSEGKTILGVRNACKNPHRVPTLFPEINYR